MCISKSVQNRLGAHHKEHFPPAMDNSCCPCESLASVLTFQPKNAQSMTSVHIKVQKTSAISY